MFDETKTCRIVTRFAIYVSEIGHIDALSDDVVALFVNAILTSPTLPPPSGILYEYTALR